MVCGDLLKIRSRFSRDENGLALESIDPPIPNPSSCSSTNSRRRPLRRLSVTFFPEWRKAPVMERDGAYPVAIGKLKYV
jgi:hypothetical protein